MKRYGLDLYNKFFADPRADPRYKFAGPLTVAMTVAGAAELEDAVDHGGDETLEKLPGTAFDRDLVEYVPGDALTETLLVPLVAAIEEALYRPKMRYMTYPAERASDAGGKFKFETPVRDIETNDGRVTAVITDERLAVDDVICGAGPWNIELARTVGIDLPVRHTLAPALELEPPSRLEYSLPTISHHEGSNAIPCHRSDAVMVGYIPRVRPRLTVQPSGCRRHGPIGHQSGVA